MDDAPSTRPCTPAQARTILRFLLERLHGNPAEAAELPPVMLWGPPGVGKSTVVRELCTELGIGFIDVRLAQREPVDIRGLPVPGEDAVRWLPASEWPRDPDSRGIILFDELTAADRTLQVAAYEFILDRRLGDLYRVPDGWLIAGAGNRASDRAVALAMSSALANRFCHLELEADLDTWLDWARDADIHPLVTAFLRFRPELLFAMEGDVERGWPSPRSWARVSRLVVAAEAAGMGGDEQHLLVQGLVGQGAGIEFDAFRTWADKMGDVRAMLTGKGKIRVPERADQRYAFVSALVHYLHRAKEPAGLAGRFIAIGLELTGDFAAMAMVEAMRGGEELAVALMRHPDFAAWTRKHGQAFARRGAAAGIAA